MIAVASPYHLTTREPPAMAALQLASHVVTMLPNAGADSASAQRAADLSPKFFELMDNWRWLESLWRLGVVRSHTEGRTPWDDVERAARELTEVGPLAPLMKPALLTDPVLLLEALSRDLLRGGPDPAIAIPVSAGLDAFASSEGLLAFRPEPSSVAQKAEMGIADVHGRFVLPLLTQAPGDRIIELRQSLDEELHDLRAVLGTAAELIHESDAADVEPIKRAAGAYAEAFDQIGAGLTRPDEDGVSVKSSLCTCTLASLPSDAVVRSSLAAARSTGVSKGKAAPAAVHPGTLVALIVKPLGGRR